MSDSAECSDYGVVETFERLVCYYCPSFENERLEY